jgi:hypothetical protein
MSDKMDGVAPENADGYAATEELRTAWKGLIRLLAGEMVRRLERGESASKGDAQSNVPGPTERRPGAKHHPSGRSRDQGME